MAHGSQHSKIEAILKKDGSKVGACDAQRAISRRVLLFKSVLALVLGAGLGYFKVTGFMGFVAFLPLQFLLAVLYCTYFKVPDYLMDRIDMIVEQTLPSLGLFLVGAADAQVVWSLSYTLCHW